jgi:hypothetical protein
MILTPPSAGPKPGPPARAIAASEASDVIIQMPFELDLVCLVVAPDEHGHDLITGLVEHRLDEALGRHVEKRRHRRHGVLARRGHFFGRRDRCLSGPVGGRGFRFGEFQVGRVPAAIATRDGVLPGLSQHHELVR